MNLVMKEAYEINSHDEERFVGQLMIKGDCIKTISEIN
nr:small nuclear ribonucleoprotein E [Cryptomonas sp.]